MTRSSILLALGAMLSAGLCAETAPAADGRLELVVVDRDTGRPIPCRMHLKGSNNRPRKADAAPFWHDHFVFPGRIALKLPVGNYTFDLERGPEYLTRQGHFTIDHFADDSKQVDLGRFIDMAAKGWWSGDLDVRRSPRDIELLMAADDLHVAELVTWSNGKSEWDANPLPQEPLVCFDGNRCYHLMAGCHAAAGTEWLIFHMPAPLRLPAGGGFYPPSVRYLVEARKNADPWVDLTKPFWWDLPMLVAAGQVDSIEVAHSRIGRETAIADEADGKARDRLFYPDPWGNAQWSQHIYFQLLECGLHIPPTAGSGSGEAPNPVGYNRVYVHVEGEFAYEKWWQSLRAGRVFVTNGPLLQPTVDGQLPGHVFRAEPGSRLEFEIGLTLSTCEPISYLEIVRNGKVEHSIRFEDYAKSGRLPRLRFEESGWFLVRAVTDLPKTYRFAMTGPYYVEIGDRPRISRKAAGFFLDWVFERARQIKLADPAQQREVLDDHRKARDFWQDLAARANAE